MSTGLTAGNAGTGRVAIDTGSDITVTRGTANVYLGMVLSRQPGSQGTVTVDGQGSTLISQGGAGQIGVGRDGAGVLEVTGAAEANEFFFVVGRSDGSDGLLRVDGEGSRLTASDAVGNFTTCTGYPGFLRAGRDFGSHGSTEVTNSGVIDVQNDPASNYDVPVIKLGRGVHRSRRR
ncbi:MAG: hypothetical protein AAF713_01025 [Pseudomonadota bacterium]